MEKRGATTRKPALPPSGGGKRPSRGKERRERGEDRKKERGEGKKEGGERERGRGEEREEKERRKEEKREEEKVGEIRLGCFTTPGVLGSGWRTQGEQIKARSKPFGNLGKTIRPGYSLLPLSAPLVIL